ncbi:MAG: glycosyltransferase family 2 protein [Bacteroidales bacterium]|nr:glycosyltransferase family 2 protein [Bacteroidales bacterium]
MGFASAYLARGAIFPQFIHDVPASRTGIIVVIPAYDEPDIDECLASLSECAEPPVPTEVIIVVNSPMSAGKRGLEANRHTMQSINGWLKTAGQTNFRLYVFDAGQPAVKGWGVGTARKAGMDEAVRRFDTVGNPGGVIASLDADCKVSENYFVSLWNDFGMRPDAAGCSIRFRHRLDDSGTDPAVVTAVRQYEMHLNYYVDALRFTGFPYAYHTIGSAMAVKAFRYVKAGGMPRRQGGEDFYLIQKLVVSDDYINLGTATVYPSPRASMRVPFGTGPAISGMLDTGATEYLTYNPEAFRQLKEFFDWFQPEKLRGDGKLPEYQSLPEAVRLFVSCEEWQTKTEEIVLNTSTPEMLGKRFFTWFNAFKIVKYLNLTHTDYFTKVKVGEVTEVFIQDLKP